MNENHCENLQLAKTITMDKVAMPCRAERKLDGIRVYLLDGHFYTRKGNEIFLPGVKNKLTNAEGMFIDMEATLEEGKKTDRSVVQGLLNSAQHGNSIDEGLIYFNVFDAMESDTFKSKLQLTKLKDRLYAVDSFVLMNKHLRFRSVPFTNVLSIEELQKLYDREVSEGYEGLVTKHYNDMYQFKRSNHWARFKPTKTADLICVGVQEGQGKYTGMIGAISLTGEVEGRMVLVKAGSGMTDEDRSLGTGTYLGKTIEVKYDSVTQDKTTGQYSLFQPRFKRIRFDK